MPKLDELRPAGRTKTIAANNKEPQKKPLPEKRPFSDNYDLPPGYNTTKLTLIARDPHWIYAYWEIGQGAADHLRDRLGGDSFDRSTYVLRMYDVTCVAFNGNNANSWFDTDVGKQANNWYITLWSDNVTYCADLGMRTSDGKFLPIARSNYVTTPRKSMSERSDLIWMEVKDGKAEQPFVTAVTPRAEDRKPAKAAARPRERRRRIFLSEDDVRSYYSKLFPLHKLFIAARQLRSRERLDTFILKHGYLPGFLWSEFVKKIRVGASEELILMGGASEQKLGASEREAKKRQFFFEIGAELIVYGRTEADASVSLGDKKINLRKDGTFTLRFALPDGKIPLDFTAQSSDGAEQRKIKTSVEREKTVYEP